MLEFGREMNPEVRERRYLRALYNPRKPQRGIDGLDRRRRRSR